MLASVGTHVPREYVHKEAESEVLLTGCQPIGPDTFRVTARWPVDHAFYRPVHGLFDPLLGAESIRQAVPLLSHAVYDVPLGHKQSWGYYRQTLNPTALESGGSAAEIELRIACTDITRRAGRLASLTMRVDMLREGRPLGTAELAFRNHPPAIYKRLRRRYADIDWATSRAIPTGPSIAPQRVAREQPADVVLSTPDSPNCSQLRADLSHRVLFDHPVDHVPGMLLLEAARQSAHVVAHPRPTVAIGLEAVFRRYVELDAPCWIQSGHEPPRGHEQQVGVCAVQHGEELFTSTVTLASAA
ncbi:gamma-butyrolactone biosynthesis enzyme [Streptomyces sioyaensis]|uniref:ScbA/BarX family gamma-butyrolactone biosynthesis protein n=1 Tax=Streptomyces sioyaensis TaxID=67364 RepID=UPI0027E4F8D6|nr:ScbA/BarX family gamma-butyrolactone biosynthesis protein [Streptomyces sioyaensis]MCF3172870.1 gamma-butyrolactone biosynthesis enzyme [Streptomyces sioyaensis]